MIKDLVSKQNQFSPTKIWCQLPSMLIRSVLNRGKEDFIAYHEECLTHDPPLEGPKTCLSLKEFHYRTWLIAKQFFNCQNFDLCTPVKEVENIFESEISEHFRLLLTSPSTIVSIE